MTETQTFFDNGHHAVLVGGIGLMADRVRLREGSSLSNSSTYFTPTEARELASALIEAADTIAPVRGND